MDDDLMRLRAEHAEMRNVLVGILGTDNPDELKTMAKMIPLMGVGKDHPAAASSQAIVEVLLKIRPKTSDVLHPSV